jgi:hypothetical protein
MNFNWEIYKELNPDLGASRLTKEQIEKHYKNNAIKENRHVKIADRYPDFNLFQYRKNYADLAKLTDVQLIIHWIRHGVNEERTYLDLDINVKEEVKEKVIDESNYKMNMEMTTVHKLKEEVIDKPNYKMDMEMTTVHKLKEEVIDEPNYKMDMEMTTVHKLKENFNDLSKVPYINQKNYMLSKPYSIKIHNIYTLQNHYIKILKGILKHNVNNRSVLLTIADSVYPANGGGENWLLDINKILEEDYFCIAICFRDIFSNKWFSDIKYIKYKNVHVIQMPIVVRDLIAIIEYLKPICISHQGHNRLLYCKIAKLMKINFMTGYCFWNDLLTIENDYFNINMEDTKYTEDPKLTTILENSNVYLASDFMKKIVKNNIKQTNIDIKLSELNIDVIPTISYHKHYINVNKKDRKYVCILNSHFLKGGQELIYLLKNLDYDIPILSVITERDWNIDESMIIELFRERNSHSDINILYRTKINNISDIYDVCKVLLIPSIVDETFCKVAYEGMQLGLPIISYKTGNIEYLLKEYTNNTFIDMPFKNKSIKSKDDLIVNIEKLSEWKDLTVKIYNESKIQEESKYNVIEKEIRTKLIDKINTIKHKKKDSTIGFFCPFTDQGLGIQCREYIEYLKSVGVKTAIFSFKPYFAVQINKSEWQYDNVYYSNNNREEVILEEIIDFVFKYNVKTIIIPEICYKKIYDKVDYFKCLGVTTVAIINIELLRYTELCYYHYFDLVLANNESSYKILKELLPYNNVQLLEFNNHYMKKSNLIRNNKLYHTSQTIRIATFGGLNSYTRKNIDKTYLTFKKLEWLFKKTKNYNYKLNIYIQGVDNGTQSNILLKNTETISVHFNNYSYTEIIKNINENDILIHLGDHEGLGLGFFEALNNNKTLITLNTYPNNEYVIHGKNGYLIDCTFDELIDNNEGITNKAIVNTNNYYNLMQIILSNRFRPELYKVVMSNKIIVNNYEKNINKLCHFIEYKKRESDISYDPKMLLYPNMNKKIVTIDLSDSSYYLYKTNINVNYPQQFIYIYLKDELIHKHNVSNKNIFYTKQTGCNSINEYTIIIEANKENNIENVDFNIEWLSYHDTALTNYNIYFVDSINMSKIESNMIIGGYFIIYNFDFSPKSIQDFIELGLENSIYMLYNNVLNYENAVNMIEIIKKRVNNVNKIHMIDNDEITIYDITEVVLELDKYFKNNDVTDKTICCLASYPKRKEILLDTLGTLYKNDFDSINIFMNSYKLEDCSMILKEYKNVNILLDKLGSLRAAGKFFWCNLLNNNLFICDDDISYPVDYKRIGLQYIEHERDAIYSGLGAIFKKTITELPIGTERLIDIKFTEQTYNKTKVHLIGTGVCFFRSIEKRFPDLSYFLEYICYNDDSLAIWSKQNKKNMYAVKKLNNWLKGNKNMEIGLYEEKLVDPLKKILEKYIKENPWQ